MMSSLLCLRVDCENDIVIIYMRKKQTGTVPSLPHVLRYLDSGRCPVLV